MSSEVYIPNFSYPLSDYDTAEKYDTALDGIVSGNYLFTKDGLWHGGIHFTGAALPDAKKGVQCIADGEVVAYRVNKDYLQNEEDKNTEKGFYSTGFVLVKHKMQYPSDEKALTFFSLYMHIGKLNYMVTTDGAVVRDAQYKETEKLSKGTMLLLDETEIKYPGHESYPRYKILSINGKELSDTRSIYTGTVTKLELDKTVVPSPPIAVKASQTIAPIGEYNLAGGENRKLLHLEVFTGDDFKAFVEKAKEKYPQDKPENKPSPTNVEVPKEKKLYLKTERCKLSQDANIREGFSNTSAIYKNKATTKETTIELDPSASQKVGKYTRVLVTKIGNEDVKGKGLTVIDSVFKDKEVIFTPLEVTTLLKRFKMADLKKEKDSSNIEYMLYDKDAKQYVKYSDCKEQHPVTFEWAEIIEVKSNDFVSIYDDIEKLFIKEMQRDLKLSDSYKELFELIDKNSDHKLDPLELSNAAKDKVLKETVSKFIVQHSSEWDEEVNMAKVFIDIVEKLKDKLTDAETLKKHYKAEQARIEKLAFFKDCKSIDGFPKDHLVYHINPIGMVTEFGKSTCKITADILHTIDSNISENNRKKHIKGLNEAFETFKINTCLRKAHFLAQVIHESAHLQATSEYGGSSASYAPWYGRGLIQITFEENYKAYGNHIGEDVYSTEENRKKLENDPHAAKSAGWYWSAKAKLNDEADSNDFLAITYKVNGGFNGINDRYDIVKKAFKEFNLTLSTDYLFVSSWIYSNAKASFAWGLWHDPLVQPYKGNIVGCTKDANKAKEGYTRAKKLLGASSVITNYYNIQKHPELNSYKNSEGKINVYKFAEKRLTEL
ncbi:hypothetical protein [Sulfurimonas sp. HSL3-2]|uniref:glycoside hydrolase family 19 protein n=1 Tax=Hydrocurvibacter mobilis TaxID=3131936 RepID=UPI0031F8D4A4